MHHRLLLRIRILLGCRRGATAIEYGLLCALIVLGMLVAVRGLATGVVGLWSNVSTSVGEVQ